MLRIALNGYGRIGRALLRALFERGLENQLHVEAINEVGDFKTLAHLTRFDSTFGRFNGHVGLYEDTLQVHGQSIHLLGERELTRLPWKQMGVDVVVDCTGKLKKRVLAEQHLVAGAPRVLLSHPLDSADLTVVYGVNHHLLGNQQVVSNASCTTNCLAPLAKVINDNFGIVDGLMTTVHATTATQKTVDGPSKKDWRGGRGAAFNIIPSSTGAAKAVGVVIPELNKKLTGMAFRVPTADVSVVDLTVNLKNPATMEEINAVMKAASESDRYKGILGYTEDAVVSSDFIGESCTSIYDATACIQLTPTFVKLVAWYDNEWGYSCKVLDLISHMAAVDNA